MIITSKVIFFILLKKNPILRIKIIIIIAFILRASIITRIMYINTGTRNENENNRLLLISNISNMTQSVFEHGGERTCLSLYSSQKLYCIVIRISITMKRL